MRHLLLGFAVALAAACGNPSAPAASSAQTSAANAPATPARTRPPIWFFCDGIDTPVVYLFGDSPSDGRVHFTEYDKHTGATVRQLDLTTGEGDGAAGSIYTPLLNNGQDFGHVRQVNAGNFETPGAAYTTPYTSVLIDGREVRCRWLPRTRIAAFTGRRSFVISEDADGDLIYTTYDFAHASTQPIDVSDNGQSTSFSVEVRGGEEHVRPGGADFTFRGRDNYVYEIGVNRGAGVLEVQHNGDVVQTEPLIAYVEGQAEQD